MIRLLLILIVLTLCNHSSKEVEKGIVYFSFDNGQTWVNRSRGLPANIFLSDMAVSNDFLGLTTKKNGVFTFDFSTEEWKAIKSIPTESDEINALYFHQNRLLVGTKNSGIFISSDKGGNWADYNEGLQNLTIRKLIVIEDKFYAGTNGGLYLYDKLSKKWKLEYGHSSLQVNGIKELNGEIFIGTNQGAFRRKNNKWEQIMSNRSLHNIGSDRKNIYALTYNELFVSPDKGTTWHSDQKGMPVGMYTFQVIEKDNTVLAGQWDGVYVKTVSQGWALSNRGLPPNFPVLEIVFTSDFIVAGSSQWSKE
jgi:ligand-binding sensor domain-containing protein